MNIATPLKTFLKSYKWVLKSQLKNMSQIFFQELVQIDLYLRPPNDLMK